MLLCFFVSGFREVCAFRLVCSLQVLADGFIGSRGVIWSVRFRLGVRAFWQRVRLQVLVGGFRGFVRRLLVATFRLQRAVCRSALRIVLRRLLLCVVAVPFLQVLVGASFGAGFVFVVSAFVVCFIGLASKVRRGSHQQASEQGAAPDRLQLRSFLTPLPAAGELVVVLLHAALLHIILIA